MEQSEGVTAGVGGDSVEDREAKAIVRIDAWGDHASDVFEMPASLFWGMYESRTHSTKVRRAAASAIERIKDAREAFFLETGLAE